MNTKIIIAGLLAVGGLSGLTVLAQSNTQDVAIAETQQAEQTAEFAIENMTCATCPISVRKAMLRVEGVKSVDIDYKTKIASVTFDPNLTDATAIAAASTDVGYPAILQDA